MKQILNVKPVGDYRLIAISDIHGHKNHLENLLAKVKLKEEDYLVLVGDFINKGEDSYKTLKFIQELAKRERTYVLKGNHEALIEALLMDVESFLPLFESIKENHVETLIDGILKNAKLTINDFKDANHFFDFIRENYKNEMEYIQALPILLNFDEFRFVHGGFDENLKLPEDAMSFLKFDNFNECAEIQTKTTIVGHWPASELRENVLKSLPYYNQEKHIYFIDGGLGVKTSGELNALIVEKKDSELKFDVLQENDFKKEVIKKLHRFEQEELVYLRYPFDQFEVLEEDGDWLRCIHCQSQKKFTAFKSVLVRVNGEMKFLANYINRFFNIEVGEIIEVCATFQDFTFVKYHDEFGWILTEQVRNEENRNE